MANSNKVVLVTGAGSGIGEAIALRFALEKVFLSLLDINSINLEKVVEKCENLQAKVLKSVTDVTIDEDLMKAVDNTVKEFGKIDVVVNCAGISKTAYFGNTDLLEAYDKVMRVNVRSIVAMTNYTVEELAKTKGCIVNISSILSNTILVGEISYNISKAGVKHLTKCAAFELADKGIRVNCISPGPVKTNIMLNKQLSEEEGEKLFESLKKKSPLKQLTQIEEIAEMVLYLASDNARSVTGSDFVIDTGSSLIGWGNSI